ncbi:hypothetical protein SAMN05660297_01693 [Natronincola peptidivorans]|uniref:Uncharacterized protein n=1 Tax=Natronincola peptidivorans TaxID=426128 RepID=A0A1I0CJ44_9FIRM|nr:hypothetical protein [Natronincola peptidivorans]SET19662.1 hypothetical protein SAMN05660297_01693 [Natronincola peptidivorans]
MKCRGIIFAITVLLLFFLVGCTNAQVEGGNIDIEKSPLEILGLAQDFPPGIVGFIQANGKQVEMEQGGFMWERNGEIVMADAASPNQIAESFEAILLPPKAEITIQLEDQPDLTLYLWKEDMRAEEIPLSNNQFKIPLDRGAYVYEVIAQWFNFKNSDIKGTVSYTFVVEVE